MRFSLRSTAFTMLALATVAANAAGAPQFYFSTKGGDTSQLSQDLVTSSSWTAEYDIIVKNVGDADILFNAGNLLVAYATSTSQNAGLAPTAGTDGITVIAPGNTTNAAANPNVTGRAAWYLGGSPFGSVTFRGGSLTPTSAAVRPYGMSLGLDPAVGTTVGLAVGEELYIATVKFMDNGMYGNEAFHDLFLFSSPMNGTQAPQTGGQSVLLNGGTAFRQSNYEASRLRLVPEPGTMLALVAGIGALAARRRRK